MISINHTYAAVVERRGKENKINSFPLDYVQNDVDGKW